MAGAEHTEKSVEYRYKGLLDIAYRKPGAGTGDAASVGPGIVCIANTQHSMGTECQATASLAPCYVLCYKYEMCQGTTLSMHCKHQTDTDARTPWPDH